MTTWLSDASANRHIKTYVKDFLDLSGNMTVRNTNDYAWNAYGQVLSGPYESDGAVYFGIGVGMDVSGLTIVVGANSQDGANTANTDDGAVTVYRYDTTAELWYQLGNKITGETNNDEFGYNVDINDAGTRIMATDRDADFVNVYDYNSSTNTWDKQVNITTSDGIVDVNAQAGRISGDGNTIVFSTYTDNSNTGRQYVYRNTSGTTWTKIGEFTGSHTNTYAGVGPSISYDGNRITFSEVDYNYDVDGNAADDTGRVTIYDYSGSGTTWNQVGDKLYGTAAGDKLASGTDFSKDGSIVALASSDSHYVKVYQYDATVDGSWNQLGTTINIPAGNSAYGHGVRISDDGTVLLLNDARDNTETDKGALYIYKYTNGDWVQQGSTLYSQYTGARLGVHYGSGIAISGDGSKIVAGGVYADVNTTDSGYVQAFQWSQKYNTNPALDISGGTMTLWGGAEHVVANYSVSQLGSTLTGASSGIGFGAGMDMDSTGTVFAISDNYNTNYGSVSVYKYRNNLWSQLGSTLYGGAGEDWFGMDAHRISLSGNGKVLVVGALASNFYTSDGTRVRGYVNTYRYTNGDWVLFGETTGYTQSVSIVPTTNHTSSTLFGASVSINNDGTVVAIGEYNSSGKGGIWRYDSSTDSWSNEHIFSTQTSGVGISRDGTRVVTGYEGSDINVTNDGSLIVYDYNSSTQTWSQVGSTLTGYETQDRVGYRVGISGDGNTIVHCASNETSSGNSFAQVYTYVQDASGGDGDWVQKGPDFVGGTSNRYGWACKLDYDGDTVILGSPYYDKASVHKYLDGYWQQIGSDIDFDGSTGASTALNDAGTIFAVGASGTTNGSAAAYQITNSPALKIEDGNVDIGGKLNGTYVSAGSGANSIILGNNTTASGESGVAIGTSSIASGIQSIAIGTTANGSSNYGTAIGQVSTTGPVSVAIGYEANSYHASQSKQVAVGSYATATGQQGTAVGGHANALGDKSISLGYACYATEANTISIGYTANATAIHAIAIGKGANAYSTYGTAIGSTSKTTGQGTALGFSTSATGYRSVAIGAYASSSTGNAAAVGQSANAYSDYGTAIGSTTKAGGQATALGFSANATGYRSVAIGAYANTSQANAIVLGGSSSVNVGIGTSSPQGQLHISSGTSGDCNLIIEADTDNNDETDNPRIIFRQDGGLDMGIVGMNNNDLELQTGNGDIVFYCGESGDIDLANDDAITGTTERMRIYEDGDVLVKNTSTSTTRTFQVGQSISTGTNQGIFLQQSPTWLGGKIGFAGGDGASHSTSVAGCYIARDSNNLYIVNGNDGTPYADNIYIDTQGSGSSVYINEGWNNVSDNRLKHNEIVITNALDDIRQLVPKRYFKTRKLYDSNHNFELDSSGNPIDSSGNKAPCSIENGLIAQEVYHIDNLRAFIDTNPEKRYNKVHNQEDPWSIKYDNIFVHCIAALKELDAAHSQTKLELQAEKAKVATLETQMADVLARVSSLESA